jgi:hypothetical protein
LVPLAYVADLLVDHERKLERRLAKQPNRSGGGRPGRGKPGGGKPGGGGRSSSALRTRPSKSGDWELVHPRCARERADDLEEVQKMVDAGEVDIAIDELRWLLSGCADFIAAHRMLGELALAEDDTSLARAHFGYAYSLGEKAIRQAPHDALFPYRVTANRAFHEAGKGAVYCLKKLDKLDLAQATANFLIRCDPSDPLDVRALLNRPEGPPPGMQLPIIE